MKQRAFATLDLLLAVTVVSAAGAVVSPAVTRTRAQQMESVCQRNLQLLSAAVAMYVEDYGAYPTNRASAYQPLNTQAFLTPASAEDQLQLTFVEGIDRYLKAAGAPSGLVYEERHTARPDAWRCPRAIETFPPGIENAGYGPSRACYSLNYNLLEAAKGSVDDPKKMMMFRELGLLGQSYAFGRPIPGDGTPSTVFLADPNTWGGSLTCRRPHRTGSFIAFADGHVSHYSNEVAVSTRLRNDFSADPGRWGLPDVDEPEQALMWVTP